MVCELGQSAYRVTESKQTAKLSRVVDLLSISCTMSPAVATLTQTLDSAEPQYGNSNKLHKMDTNEERHIALTERGQQLLHGACGLYNQPIFSITSSIGHV